VNGSETPRISVVVPTYKRPELLAKCLESLRTQDLPGEAYEVVVVDDGSGDGTEAVLMEHARTWPALRWFTQAKNRGPAAARNRGVAEATSPLILFIDDDIVATPDLLRRHLEFYDTNDGNALGVVGHVQWHPELPVTDFMRWLDGTNLQFAFETMVAGPVEHPWEAFYTCNLSLPRRLLEEAGFFDERFPYPAFEDIDLGLRLARLGFRLTYVPSARAWHSRAVTLEVFCRRMRTVGESAVLLREAQPDLPIDMPLHAQLPSRWQRSKARLLPTAIALTGSDELRRRYFQHQVNTAFAEGVSAGAGQSGRSRT
jgi:GT2 family glycosyltransferase